MFKAFIRVVKSIAFKDSNEYMGFDVVEVLREPLIYAKDKAEVKAILLEKYPQFFQNGKVYEKETKDKAQFFYVVIFPLYNHEKDLVNEGEWVCSHCQQVYENKYLHKPKSINNHEFYNDLLFCGWNKELSQNSDCYEKYKAKNISNEIGFNPKDSGGVIDSEYHVKIDSPIFIYKITEKSTNKSYIGKTRNAPVWRWWNHLKTNVSPFGLKLRNTPLSNWTFEVLEELPCDTSNENVLLIESKYMLQYDSIKNGFNSVISNKNAIQDSQHKLF